MKEGAWGSQGGRGLASPSPQDAHLCSHARGPSALLLPCSLPLSTVHSFHDHLWGLQGQA